MSKTKLFEVVFFDLTIRDFRFEVIERTSMKAAKEYGKESDRNSDHLRFRWAQPKQDQDGECHATI